MFRPGAVYQDFGTFGPLFDFKSKHPWRVHAAWETSEPGFPHMRVLMTSAVCPGDSLFHGELLAIIGVMHKRLKTMPLCNHNVAPILLFSVVPMNHIRVIEAFYDGKQLVVRSTKNYDIKHRDLDLLIRLSRWWLGYPSDKDTKGFVPTSWKEILAEYGLA